MCFKRKYTYHFLLCKQGKGQSSSSLPYSRNVPHWFQLTSDAVVEQIAKYARKGLTPSQIGVLLRDAHGVTQSKIVTGNKILRILKSNGLAPEIPEDLYYLIKKAVSVRKHLDRNRKDNKAETKGCNLKNQQIQGRQLRQLTKNATRVMDHQKVQR